MVHIIGQEKKKTRGFIRVTGHSLHAGLVVAYVLRDEPFKIEVSREAIQIQGSFPPCDRAGIGALKQMLDRAVRHHEHLKSFPEGTKQEHLEENILEAEEAAHTLMQTTSTVQ